MVVGNSHMAMARTNKLAVIASHCQDSHFLFPSKSWRGADNGGDDASSSGDGKYELLSVANNLIAEEIRNVMSKTEVRGNSTETLLAGSLAKALCFIHKVSKELEAGQEMKSRILACDITGGLYLKIPQKVALGQYLLWVFLPDLEQRSQLVLPPPAHVDYRAACFCHRNLIEIGYVCSVCLSIFCNFSPICTTCETAFKIQLPQMVKPKKKKLKQPT
ncbi:general transcription factor IIH subunit 3 isoform X3 [Echeneis naucrates]|uniref:general transcription factor IIH subunit 3 isoform X3 n=1 Tax=Echeneis naucrates TaxID=173247 RepID=UPI00111335EF|nr:general transcription factor IIH subunit 3 isoform X3 [Echeneis naucrates]